MNLFAAKRLSDGTNQILAAKMSRLTGTLYPVNAGGRICGRDLLIGTAAVRHRQLSSAPDQPVTLLADAEARGAAGLQIRRRHTCRRTGDRPVVELDAALLDEPARFALGSCHA